jgi:CrcB protein
MLNYVWVGLGGAAGSVARYFISGLIALHGGETFPLGTLAVNVTGSFVIGIFAALTGPDGRWLAAPSFRAFFMVGVCGGYTTFSSFSLQTLNLARDGQELYAGLNAVLSFSLCLAAVWLGDILATFLTSTKGY